MLTYMSLMLIISMPVLDFLQQYKIELHITRKCFHLVAFILFLPGVSMPLTQKLMVFAFNCVSVALIVTELYRFTMKGSIFSE